MSWEKSLSETLVGDKETYYTSDPNRMEVSLIFSVLLWSISEYVEPYES